ncbi:unnamed protein product [Cyprideis torosa]|uniref:Uncharacterized protein n=1 Tax=Cyprideis torosa TaxID=163714 RepID=A0A7R8ZWQ0_9CRUS|nr:unnamed protein product [Cyprideis torosa]CAG0911927.1 unnamed protein product [Cyprideis torosa]
MVKRTKTVEKEARTYKTRFAKAESAAFAAIQEKDKMLGELTSKNKKLTALENLCRALQDERHKLKQGILGKNITTATEDWLCG